MPPTLRTLIAAHAPPGTAFPLFLDRRCFDASRPATHLFYASAMPEAVRLDASNPKWIQLCTAGRYVYRGQPVTITPQTFDRFVANFRASPAYKADGVKLLGREDAAQAVLAGGYGVIALNFDHPPQGGPRPGHGWFVELERRGEELWGLCWFDAAAHKGMTDGTWKWTSIEWTEDTKNNTGQDIGPYLSGVALTNDPFITGMTPIQMSRCADCQRQHAAPGAHQPPFPAELTPDEQRYVDGLSEEDVKRFADYPWEDCVRDQKKAGHGEESAKKICGSIKAKNASRMSRGPVVWFGPAGDVVCELKACLGLPETADAGALLGELAKVRAWALGPPGSVPLGVDVLALLEKLRGVLNLPRPPDAQSIFAHLDTLLGALADEQEKETPMNAPTTPNTAPAGLGLARTLAPLLSVLLAVPVQDDDASVIRAFGTLTEKTKPALKLFDAMGGKYDEAMGHVQALQAMFPGSDAKGITDKLAQLMALGDQLSALLGEVAAEHEAEEKAEGDMAAQDVSTVMQAQRLDPKVAAGTVKAYTVQRLGFAAPLTAPKATDIAANPKLVSEYLAAVRKRREERRTARTSFFSAHGMADALAVAEQVPMHLRGALLPALFGGQNAMFAPQNGQAGGGQQGAPMAFGGATSGQPFNPSAGASMTWTAARVQTLPPGANDGERIFAEVVRTEMGGKKPAPGSNEYETAWARVSQIMGEVARSQWS